MGLSTVEPTGIIVSRMRRQSTVCIFWHAPQQIAQRLSLCHRQPISKLHFIDTEYNINIGTFRIDLQL